MDNSSAAQKVAARTGSGRLAALTAWIDERFPLTALWKSQVSEYYAPKNFNVWYYFGSLALFVLVIQIVSGIFLTMNYKPSAAEAFNSVEYIMRDVEWGWLIRYIHSTGRVGVLHRRLPAHVPCADVRLVPEAARAAVDLRHADLLRADGRGVHGLPAAVGQHVLLGRAGDRVAVRRDSLRRRLAHRVDPRRLLHLRRHAEPILRAARRRDPVRAGVPRDRAPDGAARSRLEQSRTASRSRR